MKEEFDSALFLVQCKVLDKLCNDLSKVPEANRGLLISLGWKALDSLYDAMETGPDRIAAIKVVLEMAGLLKGELKSGSEQLNSSL